MAKENVKKFFEKVAKDESLQKEFKEVVKADQADAIVSMAKKIGFDFTAEDLLAVTSDKELGDSELDAVAGGWSYNPWAYGGFKYEEKIQERYGKLQDRPQPRLC